MAAAVVVTSPAGAATPECPILLLATDPVVVNTLFLDWLPIAAAAGGAAQVSLATFQAVKAFLPRCKIARNPADMTAANNVNLLVLRFEDAFWSRLLTELTAADVFTEAMLDYGSLHEKIAKAVLPNPTNLEIVAADWRAAPAFAVGPGGPGAAGVAARNALARVRFLSLISVTTMEDAAMVCPFDPICTMVGILGACLTQAARQSEVSSVRLSADIFRTLQPNGLSDGALATKAAAFFPDQRLPFKLWSVGVRSVELRDEFEHGIDYNLSTDGRRRVEERRVLLLGSTRRGCALPSPRLSSELLSPVTPLSAAEPHEPRFIPNLDHE